MLKRNLKIDDSTALRPIQLEDAREIYENFSLEIIEFLPVPSPPKAIGDTIEFTKHCLRQWQDNTDMVWVILDEDEFSGCCGLHSLRSKQPHFGIWVKKEKQGKGIGKKVVHYVLNWGVQNLNVDFIRYPVDKRNLRSIGIIEDLGLKPMASYEIRGDKKLSVVEYKYFFKN